MDGPYQDKQIANMDEGPLWIDMTPEHTLDFKGVKEVALKCTNKYKVRATLVLDVFADGTKLTPMLIFNTLSALRNGHLSQSIFFNKYRQLTMEKKNMPTSF